MTAATASLAARNDAERPAATPPTTTSVTFDPAMLEMIYKELDTRTDQVVGQVPLEAPTVARAYRQTLADQETATATHPYTAV